MMNARLSELVRLARTCAQSNLKFNGFSRTSIHFFDDMPSKSEAPDWMKQKKESGEFGTLKSEFIDLVHDLCEILCLVDIGFESDYSGNNIIGNETLQGARKGQPAPITGHHWCAMHTRGVPKTEDIQFFINHTSLGLRVGIYDKRHRISNRWNEFLKRLHKNKDEIFSQYQAISEYGFHFVKTPPSEYFNHSMGRVLHPSSAEEMYEFVCMSEGQFKQSFGLLNIIPHSSMSSNSLIDEILDQFILSRKIYELLQPRKFEKKREVTSEQVISRRISQLKDKFEIE